MIVFPLLRRGSKQPNNLLALLPKDVLRHITWEVIKQNARIEAANMASDIAERSPLMRLLRPGQ